MSTDESRPDFRHVETWVFDLDNTLYPPSTGLFAQIDDKMRAFIGAELGLSDDAARALQKQYYREHGTTLNGLMHVHNIEPQKYLRFVHDIDLSLMNADQALDAALGTLPGRKVVFTNGSVAHAENVLKRLGIERHFDDLFDIVATSYRPKPAAEAYAALVDRLAIDAKRAAMFDDLKRNLVAAAQIGMTTVWVAHDHEWSRQGPETPGDADAHVHHVAHDLAAFLTALETEDSHERA